MTILLKDIWPIQDQGLYKIHFARKGDNRQPLDGWVGDRGREEWTKWQETWPGRNDFNRKMIFSLMQFYHETDIWLFGGVFEVLGLHENGGEKRYEVQLTDQGKDFIGRLKIRSTYRNRTTRTNMEPYYKDFEVQEILREPYSGRKFSGYDEIDLSFDELEALVKNERQDWKTALESIKGVYLITDTESGKRYVGSAYGDRGIWSRWKCYSETGDGGNKGIHALIAQADINPADLDRADLAYCRKNFRFSLLEQRLSNTSDEKIIERESFWKRILLTRGEHGLNCN